MKLKNFFKSFCFVLACILMFSTVIIPTTAESTAPSGSWKDSAATEVTAGPDGSYIVDSAEKLAWLLNATFTSNPTVYITADIDLSAHCWPGIASFNGTIIGKKGNVDGTAVTISGMTSEENLSASWAFILGSSDLTMKNVNFTGANGSISANAAISVICAGVGTSAVFENVAVSSSSLTSSTTESVKCVGGVIGTTTGPTNITMTNVTVSGLTLSAKTHAVGGVIGRAHNNGSVLLENVNVTGLTTETAKTGSGGMIGRIMDGDDTKGNFVFTKCSVSNSKVESKDNTVAGFVGAADNLNLVFMDCVFGEGNTLTVAETASPVNVGMYVGETGGDAEDSVTLSLLNCTWSNESSYCAIGNASHKFKCYKTGEIVANNRNTNITYYDVAPTLLAGASIRTTVGTNGLRFTSTADANAQAGLKALGAAVSYGTLICQADRLTEGVTFTEEGLEQANVTLFIAIDAVNGITKDDAGNISKFNAALLVNSDDKAITYAARSYVDISITAHGKTVTTRVYSNYSKTDNVRSMQDVADAALADVKESVTASDDGFDYKYAVTVDNVTKYSCYTASEYDVLKTWASTTTSEF